MQIESAPDASGNMTGFVYVVFYSLSEDSEFNYLASFATREAADEYAARSVWSHLRPYVSRQPVF